jgi:hypothetical protein
MCQLLNSQLILGLLYQLPELTVNPCLAGTVAVLDNSQLIFVLLYQLLELTVNPCLAGPAVELTGSS